MTDIALRSGANAGVTKVAASIDHQFYYYKKKLTSYGEWTNDYLGFFWVRVLLFIILLGLPACFLGLSVWALTAYAAPLAIPLAHRITKKNSDSRYSTRQAHKIVQTLKEGWAEHGNALYRQIWAHDCSGDQHEYCYSKHNCSERIVKCDYCDDRIQELERLRESQRSVEVRSVEPVNNMIFEASEHFRKAVAEQLELRDNDTNLMKEISASVKR